MPYLTNLAVIARRTGFPVVEEWGWKTRGHGPMSAVRSVICHHDAANQSPTTFNTVVRDGRSGLPGPLAQFAIRRDGTIHVVAAGLSYHAGSNVNPSLYNNSYALGIEAGNNGVGEPWPRKQIDAYEALCAELCKAFRLPVSRVRGHKEIAPSRKIDPAGINMDHFRAAVARRMTGGGGAAPAAPAKPTPSLLLKEDSFMTLLPYLDGYASVSGVVPERDVNMVLHSGFVDTEIVHVKFFDADGKFANPGGNMHKGTLRAGKPWWIKKVPDSAVSFEVFYKRTNGHHAPGVGFRRDYA